VFLGTWATIPVLRMRIPIIHCKYAKLLSRLNVALLLGYWQISKCAALPSAGEWTVSCCKGHTKDGVYRRRIFQTVQVTSVNCTCTVQPLQLNLLPSTGQFCTFFVNPPATLPLIPFRSLFAGKFSPSPECTHNSSNFASSHLLQTIYIVFTDTLLHFLHSL
jgi:hypothetical protein